MTRKTLITGALLAFVGASLAFTAYRAVRESRAPRAEQVAPALADAPATPAVAEPAAPATARRDKGAAPAAAPKERQERRLLAYYFHGYARCQTCRKLEAYAQEALETGFGPDLKAGKVQWQAVNVEEPANTHFVKDFDLDTKSVVLAISAGGRIQEWKNLPRIWELVDDKDRYLKYVQDEVRAYQARL